MTDLSDMLLTAKRRVERLGVEVSDDFEVAMGFASRFADVMLNLTVVQEENSCLFRLDRRREQYAVELSNVLTEETYLVGSVPLANEPADPRYVGWKGFFVERAAVTGCVDSLFQKIAQYEGESVDYLSEGRHLQRAAGVSITGFDALSEFGIAELKDFPKIYTSINPCRSVLACKVRALGDEAALKVLAEYSS